MFCIDYCCSKRISEVKLCSLLCVALMKKLINAIFISTTWTRHMGSLGTTTIHYNYLNCNKLLSSVFHEFLPIPLCTRFPTISEEFIDCFA